MRKALAALSVVLVFAESTCGGPQVDPGEPNGNPAKIPSRAPGAKNPRNPKLRLQVNSDYVKNGKTIINYEIDEKAGPEVTLTGTPKEGITWIHDVDIWFKGATIRADRDKRGSLYCSIWTWNGRAWILQDGPHGYDDNIGVVRCSYGIVAPYQKGA